MNESNSHAPTKNQCATDDPSARGGELTDYAALRFSSNGAKPRAAMVEEAADRFPANMRIVQFFGQSAPGGVTTHILDLTEGLAANGHSVVIAAERDAVVWELAKQRGLRCADVGPLGRKPSLHRDWQTMQRLRCIVADEKADILHLHSFKAGMLGRIRRRATPKIVYTPHCPVYLSRLPRATTLLGKAIERTLSYRSDGIIAVGSWEHEHLNLTPSICIRNGVSLSPGPFRPHQRRSHLAVIGRFEPQKRPDLVLRAVALIPAECQPSVEFFGDGSTLGEIRELASSLPIVAPTIFHGHVDDPWSHMVRPDCLVQMSDWEATPYTILEALARAVPVISSPVGEALKLSSETNSVWLSANEPEHLATSIQTLGLLEDDQYDRLCREAFDFANLYLGVDGMISATEHYYRTLLQPR